MPKAFVRLLFTALLACSLAGCLNIKDDDNANMSLDEIYELIKGFSMDGVYVVDLPYDVISADIVIIGDQAFGTRNTITNDLGESTERLICYMLEDDTEVYMSIGQLPFNTERRDLISIYNDLYRRADTVVGAPFKSEGRIESSILLYDSVIIEILSFNESGQSTEIIGFTEAFVDYLGDF